jgi:Protein of unknown function (DUF3934)
VGRALFFQWFVWYDDELNDMNQVRRERMSKPKKKSGTGQGTGKKGWNRWQAGANKAKSNKPYKSKGVKHGNKADAEK